MSNAIRIVKSEYFLKKLKQTKEFVLDMANKYLDSKLKIREEKLTKSHVN